MKAGPPTGATGSLLCRFLAIVRECSCRHFAPHQSNSVWRFRGQSFPRGKALTYLGRGAMRLSRVRVEVTLARRGMQRLPGPGGPFRSEREPLGCAFPENPWGFSLRGVSDTPAPNLRKRRYIILIPPSMAMVWPVMKPASGEHKKAMVAATSSAVPKRPNGVSFK